MPIKTDLNEKISAIPLFAEHRLTWVGQTGSTNDDLKSAAEKGDFSLIRVADFQSSGRGQFDRKWEAEPDASLMFSFSFVLDLASSFPISLLAGLAVLKALKVESKSNRIWLKWPNDIYAGRKKLGGILVENLCFAKRQVAIVGIGINFKPALKVDDAISLEEIGCSVTKEALLVAILSEFSSLRELDSQTLLQQWADGAGDFWNSEFIFKDPTTGREKVVRPVDIFADGSLKLKVENAEELKINSGRLVLAKHRAA